MEHHAIPLTDTGRRQSVVLAGLLPPAPSMIYRSPFLRARQTAEPSCTRTGLVAEVLQDLHEFDAIDPQLLHGMTGQERRPVANRYWAEADPDRRMGPHAETFREFGQRVDDFRMAQLSALPDGAVLFGHGIWIGMLVWQLMGFSATDSAGIKSFRRFQSGLPMLNGALYRIAQPAPRQWAITVGDLGATEFKRLKKLEDENARLKRIMADLVPSRARRAIRVRCACDRGATTLATQRRSETRAARARVC